MPKVRCREIADSDVQRVVNLLAEGFPSRSRERWAQALERLSVHATPAGLPRYGYMLESDETPVGVLLLIFSWIPNNESVTLRCNVSSWYVRPEFRAYAPLLSSAIRRPSVTYFNVSPAPHTLSLLEAQGYSKYCVGLMLTLPWLSSHSGRTRVERLTSGKSTGLRPAEETLLSRHSDYGCISLRCVCEDDSLPFVFAPCRTSIKYGRMAYARLIYCRDLTDFVRFARPLGIFLARCGLPIVAIDANARVRELRGLYTGSRPKYFKGPNRPRLGDLAYSEVALFDVEPDRYSKRANSSIRSKFASRSN